MITEPMPFVPYGQGFRPDGPKQKMAKFLRTSVRGTPSTEPPLSVGPGTPETGVATIGPGNGENNHIISPGVSPLIPPTPLPGIVQIGAGSDGNNQNSSLSDSPLILSSAMPSTPATPTTSELLEDNKQLNTTHGSDVNPQDRTGLQGRLVGCMLTRLCRSRRSANGKPKRCNPILRTFIPLLTICFLLALVGIFAPKHYVCGRTCAVGIRLTRGFSKVSKVHPLIDVPGPVELPMANLRTHLSSRRSLTSNDVRITHTGGIPDHQCALPKDGEFQHHHLMMNDYLDRPAPLDDCPCHPPPPSDDVPNNSPSQHHYLPSCSL